MILCSHGNNGVQLLVPPENSKMGDRIYIDTLENFPVPVLPPKKKVWENVQPKLKIENGHAFYGDKIFKNENGLVLAPGVEAGTIS